MENINVVCTLDGVHYKEYEVSVDNQSLGIIAWNSESDPALGQWCTAISDGTLRHFQTQEEVLAFLKHNPLKSAVELSATLKAEAHRLMDIAEEIENKSANSGVQRE